MTFLTNIAGAALTTNNWTLAGSGKWETPVNWSSGSAPSLSDAADFITNTTTKTVMIDATTTNTPSAMIISNLTITGTANSTNTLFLNNAGTLTPLRILGTNSVLALSNHGALVVNNSAIAATNTMVQPVQIIVGSNGANASLTISNGGSVFNDTGYVGFLSPGNTALITDLGSVWNCTNLYISFIAGGGNQMIISNGGAVYSISGILGSSPTNSVLITGLGSVWNSFIHYVGDGGYSNKLTIANGGAAHDVDSYVGFTSSSNTLLVTGLGSFWNSTAQLNVGYFSGGANQMIVSNGAAVHSGSGFIGSTSSSSNTVLVTGPGSTWNCGTLYVGQNTSSNTLTVSNVGAVIATQVVIGASLGNNTSNNNNIVRVTGGSLVTINTGNGQLIVSQAGGKGSLILSNGSVTVEQLIVTNGANSVFTFAAGTLSSGNTYVTNNQLFVVGDGTDAATFQINGGVHNFANNLEIRSNAVLIGCGTINGNVTIDPGGTLLASCGTLTVTGIITNNGVLQASAGRVVEVYGPVVNNGTIDLAGGSTMFHSSFTDNGIVLATLEVVGIANETNNIRVTWTSPLGQTNELQATTAGPSANYNSNNFVAIFTVTNAVNPTTNFLDVGAGTNFTSRYYRLRLVP
ncbi:MAG TPA: hypothetical protein VNL17_03815 [Verrucomicrobiae bacterium]|nr:hypothetical protein [Verrucomicrobiae bacterium]